METHEYPNGEITILWKPKLCTHSGICVKTLPQVYNPKARPWIKTHNATTEELRKQIAMCPSGALSIKNEPAENGNTTGEQASNLPETPEVPETPEEPEAPKRKTKYLLEQDVKGSIGTERFKSTIHWRKGSITTDEPEKIGGKELGPDPYTLLLSSLMSCTLATLRMYIDHKQLDIPEVHISTNMTQRIKGSGEITTTIEQSINFGESKIEPDIEKRLFEIADNCPISKILKGNILIDSLKPI